MNPRMMFQTRFLAVLAFLPLVAMLLMMTGCDGSNAGSNAASGEKKLKIAVILFQEDQFFRLNEMGMKAAAEEQGVEMLVSNSFGKVDKEMQLVETYTAKGVDAILVRPNSSAASTPALKKAHDAGVKIVTYDTSLESDFPVASIASDQVKLGEMTGAAVRKYIEQKLDGTAKVAIIQFVAASLEEGPKRPSGFESQIKDMPGVQIVARQDAWLAHKANEVVETLLGSHPDLDIIWAANEGGTVGAVTAVRNAGKAGKVVVFGTDISAQLADFLLADDNILQAVTAQKPFEMGHTAMTNAVKAIRGEPVVKGILLNGELYSRDNLDAVRKVKAELTELSK